MTIPIRLRFGLRVDAWLASLLVLAAVACSSDDAEVNSGGHQHGDVDAGSDAQPADAREDPLQGRSYDVRKPSSYDGSKPVPLVVMVHPMYASKDAAQKMDEYLGISAQAEQRGMLLAIPHGTYDELLSAYMWNATDSCCAFFHHRPDDAGFIMAMIEKLKSEYNVDESRIYAIGQSNGGFMVHRLACDNSHVFAAIASLSGAVYAEPALCAATEPVSVLHVHGDADGLVPFAGGPPFEVTTLPPAPGAHETVGIWAKKNGCSSQPTSLEPLDLVPSLVDAETTHLAYDGCSNNSAAELWVVHGGEHLPPFTSEWARRVFDFLLQHPKAQQ
jgi:polyhydroxybutyrate depolymerase